MARLLNQLRSSERICAVVDFLDDALLYQFFDLFPGLAHERDLCRSGSAGRAGACRERALVVAV